VSWFVDALPLPDGDQPADLWIDDAGRLAADPLTGAERLPGRYVLPGLVDAHAHPTAGWTPAGPAALAPAQALATLRAWAESGVCVVRDTGSPGGMALDLTPDPGLPRLQAAGRFLAPAGQYFPALLTEGVPQERLTDLALAELARGARWVKLIADFPAVTDGKPSGRPTPTYSADAVAAMIAAVHAAGGRVAAHVTTSLVGELVQAGVDSVEHGTALGEADLRRMAETGAAWTPTLTAVLALPAGAPESAQRRVADYRQRLPDLLAHAHRLGVPVLTGTDTVGTVAGEIALLAQYGLEPAAAMAAATTTGYRFLGEPFGQPGQLATIVTYESDPRDDLSVLSSPSAVLIDGVRVR
jgi:imidazolonepropionase-like amidohydrolase